MPAGSPRYRLYLADRISGTLATRSWVNGAPSGTATVVSGPAVDGNDWRGRAVWLHTRVNVGPAAAFSASCPELACTFNGSASNDSDGSITSYAWNFGDGAAATGATTSHLYTAAGTYTVTLTVTDNDGATHTATQIVTVTAPPTTTVGFRATAGFNDRAANPSVAVPETVQAGDSLLLALTAAENPLTVAAPTGVTGWTRLGTQTTNGATSTVWHKVAEAGDAGSALTVALGVNVKADLRLLAYSGTSTTNPVVAFASGSDATAVTSHTSPTVSVIGTGRWAVTLWSDKSSSTNAWAPPDGVTTRATTIGTGSGRITTLITDTSMPVPAGTYGALTATTDAASRGITWTIVLTPPPADGRTGYGVGRHRPVNPAARR